MDLPLITGLSLLRQIDQFKALSWISSCMFLSNIATVFNPELFGYQYIGFKPLKVILLKCMSVRGEEVEYFLSNAPALERLAVHRSPKLVHFRVSGQSLCIEAFGDHFV